MNQNPLVLNNGLPVTTALSASGPLNYAQAYFGPNALWSNTTTGSYGDFTFTGSDDTLTIRESSGLALTAAASNLPGIIFTPISPSAVYLITVSAVQLVTPVSTGMSLSLTDGMTIISSSNQIQQQSGSPSVIATTTVSGIYIPGTTSPVTVKLQGWLSGGTGFIGNTGNLGGTNVIEWTVVQLSNNGGNNGVTAWNTNLSVTPSGAFGSYSGLVTQSRIVGNNLECKVYMTAGTNSGTIMSLALPSGYIIDSFKLNSIGSFLNGNATSLSSPGNVILATSEFQSYPFYDGSDTANIYFAASTQSGTFVKQIGTNFVDSGAPWLCEFSVPIVGLFASSSINGSYASGETSNAGSWVTTSTSFVDGTNSGGNSYTANQSNNIIVTAAAGNVAGISFTPADMNATYSITASTAVSTNTSNGGCAFRLVDGNGVIIDYDQSQNGTGLTAIVRPIKLSGVYVPNTVSPITVKIEMAAYNGGTETMGDFSGLNPSIFWNITRIS